MPVEVAVAALVNCTLYLYQSISLAADGHESCVDSLQAASVWLYIVPWGLGKLLTWITKRYNRPQLFVTENGEL